MKYLNLIYSKNKVGEYKDAHNNHYDSTSEYRIIKKASLNMGKEDCKVLHYKLRSNKTVEKWINLFTETEKALENKFGSKVWRYNYYSTPSWEIIHSSRVKMNSIIDTVNERGWFELPDRLKLSVDDTTVKEMDKLNELHFIFETQSVEKENHPEFEEMFYYLEAINNLVHLCEKYTPDNGFISEFHSYRLQDDLLDLVPMETEDYNAMDFYIAGTAMIDFGTVGKDLGACYETNDLELVKRKEIKQQEYARPYLSFDWTDYPRDREAEYEAYYKWCDDNEIENYGYNVREPKYNLGRVIIGDLVGKETFKTSDIQNILINYPYFVDIVLSEEPL